MLNPRTLSEVKNEAVATAALMYNLAGQALPEWDSFVLNVKSTTLAPNQSAFHQGDENPFIYVVRSGLVKSVYTRSDGTAWIKSFTSEGGFIASLTALQDDNGASFTLTAIEKTILERIPYSNLLDLAETNLVWSNVLRRAFTLYGLAKEKRERDLLTLLPEARYRAFKSQTNNQIERITQKDLAAWLGVTPVGLNRIIKRVELENKNNSSTEPAAL